MQQLDAFLEGKSLRTYLHLCFIPVLLILFIGLPRWTLEYSFFALLIPVAILGIDRFATHWNPSTGNKIISDGVCAAVFFFTAPSTIVLFPSGIPLWLFYGFGFWFMYCFVARAISLKQQFRDGIDTPYGKCMWHS